MSQAPDALLRRQVGAGQIPAAQVRMLEDMHLLVSPSDTYPEAELCGFETCFKGASYHNLIPNVQIRMRLHELAMPAGSITINMMAAWLAMIGCNPVLLEYDQNEGRYWRYFVPEREYVQRPPSDFSMDDASHGKRIEAWDRVVDFTITCLWSGSIKKGNAAEGTEEVLIHVNGNHVDGLRHWPHAKWSHRTRTIHDKIDDLKERAEHLKNSRDWPRWVEYLELARDRTALDLRLLGWEGATEGAWWDGEGRGGSRGRESLAGWRDARAVIPLVACDQQRADRPAHLARAISKLACVTPPPGAQSPLASQALAAVSQRLRVLFDGERDKARDTLMQLSARVQAALH